MVLGHCEVQGRASEFSQLTLEPGRGENVSMILNSEGKNSARSFRNKNEGIICLEHDPVKSLANSYPWNWGVQSGASANP